MKPKLLLVEDNAESRYLIVFLLEQEGFTVVAAPDGVVALALAVREPPDAILLDIQLPVMDGYETATRLRAQPALCGVPLIAVTSYASAGNREKALRAGFVGYFEKPIDPDTFPAAIRQLLPRASP